jgi:hypothetical protein
MSLLAMSLAESLRHVYDLVARLGVPETKLIMTSGLFDPDWYAAFYADVPASGLDPATHFVRIGARARRHPSPLFDAGFYLSRYPDVADCGMTPIIHYLRYGLSEGRQTRSVARHHDCELIRASGFYDPEWYLSRYPDVGAAHVDPLEHFLDFAIPELRDPGPSFSTEYYLALNPQVATATSNPVVHYLTHRYERNLSIRGADWQRQRTALLSSGYFDPDWYLRTNLDVARAGLDPLDHYLEFGGGEGRSPSQYFDAGLYLSENREIAPDKMNPLLHYLQYGAAEKRRICHHPVA